MSHEQFQSCIEACQRCADLCDHCASACLEEQNVAELARCIKLDMDCAQICRMAAGYMARGSELAHELCQTCADFCDACADECARHEDMEHCRQCAEACRRCAEECRRMPGQAARGRSRQAAAQPAH